MRPLGVAYTGLVCGIILVLLGAGTTLIDQVGAFTTWNWWRIYGSAGALLGMIALQRYMYRRHTIETMLPAAVVVAIGVAWSAFACTWLVVIVSSDCANSKLCSGPEMGRTPSVGITMILTGAVMMLFAYCAFGVALTRDIYAMTHEYDEQIPLATTVEEDPHQALFARF